MGKPSSLPPTQKKKPIIVLFFCIWYFVRKIEDVVRAAGRGREVQVEW